MKPRIKKISIMWICGNEKGVAYGYSPLDAYNNWLKKPQILFKHGRLSRS